MSAKTPPADLPSGWSWLQWLLVPLLVLMMAEAVVRASVERAPTWYSAAEAIAARSAVQVLFAGTSRTQVAIVSRVFEAEAAKVGGRLTCLNLGRGYATDAQHYLGLRALLGGNPGNLRGVTLFYEAPEGLPAVTFLERDPWSHPEQPWLVADLLRPSELPRFWRVSGLDVQTRLHLSLRVLLHPLALLNRRERFRERLLEDVLPALLRGQWPEPAPAEVLGQDLAGPQPHSIRQDPAAVANARRSAERVGRERLERLDPPADYRGTLQELIVGLVSSVGGRVVYYPPPISALFQEGYRTPRRLADARLFAERARTWGACVVRPAFRYDDEDLPDLWHLRRERADEFTRAVAAAWLEQCPAAP